MYVHTDMIHKFVCASYVYISDLHHLPFTTTISLSELSASGKPVTNTEQVYCPPSLLSSGENVIILVYCNPLLVTSDIVTRGESDNEVPSLQLTTTSDGGTPSATVTVQVRTLSSPLTNLSGDCIILTVDWGTEDTKSKFEQLNISDHICDWACKIVQPCEYK